MRRKKIGFFQGSFDLLHYGHIRAIRRAREHCDYLILGLNSDRLYRKYRERIPVLTFSVRKKTLEAIKGVDEVVAVNLAQPLPYLKKHKVSVYFICREWMDDKQKEVAYMRQKGRSIVFLPYLKGISSKQIRHSMIKNLAKHNQRLCAACHKKL